MDEQTKNRILQLENQVKSLTDLVRQLQGSVNKGNFSNLYVFDTPVEFKKPNKFPTDITAAGAYKGRIAIVVNNITQYLHYFDA